MNKLLITLFLSTRFIHLNAQFPLCQIKKRRNDDPDKFEPREDNKGNVARAMFYFAAIYNDDADSSFFHNQKDVLLDWHYYDPVDSVEYNRTWDIAYYQDNLPNPFVIDSTLARRIWFYQEPLPAPQGVNIYIQSDSVYINWNPVPNANSYSVYSSSDPYEDFENWNLEEEGIVDTSWSKMITDEKEYYYITTHRE